MCIGYLAYFYWKIDISDAIASDAPGENECGWMDCMKYKLRGTDKPDESDDKSCLAYWAEVWQIIGETTFVLCSLYFANNEEEDRELSHVCQCRKCTSL